MSSDMAGKITGVTIDVTSGTAAGLNYKVTPLSFNKEGGVTTTRSLKNMSLLSNNS